MKICLRQARQIANAAFHRMKEKTELVPDDAVHASATDVNSLELERAARYLLRQAIQDEKEGRKPGRRFDA